jgi:hypothetical protein
MRPKIPPAIPIQMGKVTISRTSSNTEDVRTSVFAQKPFSPEKPAFKPNQGLLSCSTVEK